MVLGTTGPGAPPVPCLPQLSSTLPCGFSVVGLESNEKAEWELMTVAQARQTGSCFQSEPFQGLSTSQNEQGPVTSSLKI